MADSIYKVPTASMGPDGKPIFDVFDGTRKLELPEFQQKGLNMDQIQVGQAPTGFQSQFQPVELSVADEIPVDVLEKKNTQADVSKLLAENLARQNESRNRSMELQRQTERETSLENDIGQMEEMIRQGVQQVQERPLDGTVLKSGIAAEINNIVQGNTRESLVILRNIDTKTRLLTVEQRKRQQEIEVEKLKIDRDMASEDSLLKIDELTRQMRKDAEDKEDRLDSKQKSYLDNITSSFVGLAYDELTPEQQRMVAQQANQVDPSGVLLAGIKNRMQVSKNQIDIQNAQENYKNQTARINANDNGGGGSGDTKIKAKFNTSLSRWKMEGSREQFIRNLQAEYPDIFPADIARKVYETYPDGYDN